MMIPSNWTIPKSSPAINAFVIVFVSNVIIFALIMNGLVIYVYTRGSARKLKLFVINLAVAEFLAPLTSYWMMVISAYHDRWLFGDFGCQYYAFTTGLFGMVSVGSLVSMAAERYIVCLYFVDKHMRMRTKYLIIIGTWVYAVLMTVPPLFGWGRYGPDLYTSSCSYDYYSNDVSGQSFMIYLLFFGFFVPVWIIITCYAGMFRQILKNEATMRLMLLRPKMSDTRRYRQPSMSKSHSSDFAADHIGAGSEHLLRPVVSFYEMTEYGSAARKPLRTKRHRNTGRSEDLKTTEHWQFVCRLFARREVQFARMTVLIVSAFFLCWTPYSIVTIFCQLGVKSFFSPTAAVITVVFAKSSVAINPIMYALKEKRFRSTVRRLLCGMFRRYQCAVKPSYT